MVRKRNSQKAGLSSGTLVHAEAGKTGPVRVTILNYSETEFEEKEVTAGDKLIFENKPAVTWINVDGIHQPEIIQKIGDRFSLHPLLLEGISNTKQRPKIDDYGDHMLVVLRMLYLGKENGKVTGEQVSLILGPNYVISFQEREGDVFDVIRDNIRQDKGRIRKTGADYLAYALINAIVDHCYIILEEVGDTIEDVEQRLAKNPSPRNLQLLRQLKKEMLFIRKSVWPLREVVSHLECCESQLIHASTGVYLRDVYNHTIEIIDMMENYRDMTSGMLDIYFSSISNRMNEIIKVLTIFASIFIPLTFIASLYGMNFRFMPELGWRWGYFSVLLVMVLIGVIMIMYFRRKKWL